MGQPAQVDEDIQMHADVLFQRMLKHEEAVEKAKQDGNPIPVFDIALPQTSTAKVTPAEEVKQRWKEKLDKLPENERAVEEAALRADLEAKAAVVENVQKLWAAQREERETRQAEGRGTIGDTLAGLFGRWGK